MEDDRSIGHYVEVFVPGSGCVVLTTPVGQVGPCLQDLSSPQSREKETFPRRIGQLRHEGSSSSVSYYTRSQTRQNHEYVEIDSNWFF